MKKIQKILILLTLAVLVNCSEDNTVGGVEFGTITGRVVKANSFEPIENAKVTLSPTNNTTFTDANGDFIFDEVPTNDYSVEASKEDFLTSFEPVSLEAGATVNVVFEMEIETALNDPPTTPELITPTDGTTDLENSVELIWSSSDPDDDSLEYRLEIRNDFNSDVIAVGSLTDTTYVASDLKYGAKYFWQVAATDNINPEVISSSSSFTIKVDPGNRYFYVKEEGGNNIIYSANYNENAGGGASSTVENVVQLTSSSNNSWRPRKNNQSNLIGYLATDNNETHLFTMLPNGDGVTKVTSTIPVTGFNLNELDFSWNTNGSKFLYPYFDKLYSINKDGSGLEEVYQTTNGNYITEIDWSNDGTKIALKTNDLSGYNVEIFTIDMNGTVIDNVLSGVSGAAGGINFSIDGKLLLYTYDVSGFQSSDYRQLDTHIFIYDFQTASASDESGQKVAGTNDLDPRFSPNEAEIIFVNTSNDGISQRDIVKMEIDGVSTTRTILFPDAKMPDWE